MFTFGKPIFGKLNNFMKILFSFLIIFNPVVIQQMFTYYNDFLVYCWFMVLLFGFFNIETSEEIKKTDLFLIFASSVILCNIKLGGLFYTLLLLILYGIYNLIVKNKTKFILSLKMFLGVLTVVVITGINPYITNLKDGYNVFYPLAGSAKIDNITYNMPDAFQKQSLPQKFLYSTFSKSSNSIRAYRNIQIKIPFTCYEAEFNSFLYPDTRIGGFGCLWGGIMILSLFLLRYIKKEDNRENKIIALIFGIFFFISYNS